MRSRLLNTMRRLAVPEVASSREARVSCMNLLTCQALINGGHGKLNEERNISQCYIRVFYLSFFSLLRTKSCDPLFICECVGESC